MDACPGQRSPVKVSLPSGNAGWLSELLEQVLALLLKVWALLLKVWSADQQPHGPHLGALQECGILGPSPDLLSQDLHLESTHRGLRAP